jgi:flagellin-like hook-associated protein FlgL
VQDDRDKINDEINQQIAQLAQILNLVEHMCKMIEIR